LSRLVRTVRSPHIYSLFIIVAGITRAKDDRVSAIESFNHLPVSDIHPIQDIHSYLHKQCVSYLEVSWDLLWPSLTSLSSLSQIIIDGRVQEKSILLILTGTDVRHGYWSHWGTFWRALSCTESHRQQRNHSRFRATSNCWYTEAGLLFNCPLVQCTKICCRRLWPSVLRSRIW
jgi:hypothetical protein